MIRLTSDPVKTSLESAREWLRECFRRNDGAECPCCLRPVEKRPRTIYATLGRFLIWLVRRSGPDGEWVDIREYDARGGDYSKLQYWGLIETRKDPSKGKKDPSNSGLWRPTAKGVDFVYGRISVPRVAWDYDGRCWGLDSTTGSVTIRDTLGKKFSYDELMNGPLG